MFVYERKNMSEEDIKKKLEEIEQKEKEKKKRKWEDQQTLPKATEKASGFPKRI